jgi:hypothetical protein
MVKIKHRESSPTCKKEPLLDQEVVDKLKEDGTLGRTCIVAWVLANAHGRLSVDVATF